MGRGRMPLVGGGMMGEPADTGAAPRPEATPAEASGCPAVSQALVDDGRRIFTGDGNCYACHGSDARGTQVAPDLTDATWLDVDGSYGAIAGLVRSGVPDPQRFAAPMPALGGGGISDREVCEVAAFVYALGH
ncbi:MAG TPA: c-type cytochrome [Longimicrobiales bacterium]|nr:c-type cytochrome [Longimicrobiales bacterium]